MREKPQAAYILSYLTYDANSERLNIMVLNIYPDSIAI